MNKFYNTHIAYSPWNDSWEGRTPAVYLCVSMVVRVGETFQNVVGRSAHIQNAECLGQFPMQLLKIGH